MIPDLREGKDLVNGLNEMLISIIVPVYNVEQYLVQCLDSILAQTYKKLEILLVDDGSTDGSGKICDVYAARDSRITVFHTENHGLSAARNYAIDRAHGEYFAFIDSDDWFEENAIQRVIDAAGASDADIVAFRFFHEYVNETFESDGYDKEFTVENTEILKTVTLDKKISEDVWNKFYRAELFNNIRYPEGRIFEDYATTYKLLQKARRLIYIPDCLIHYRNRKNSLSNIHTMKSLVDYWIVYRERFESMASLSDEYYKVTLSETINAVSRMWRWYAGCTKNEKKEARRYLDEMRSFVKKHSREIRHGNYSRHVKITCIYAKSRNPVTLSLLYHMTKIYRNRSKLVFYEQ